jgi:hypothetical protein
MVHNIEFISYTKFGKFLYTKSRLNVFLKLINELVFGNTFTFKDWYIIIFTLEVKSA